jgi:AcrR family transcriptional regulator
VARVAGFSVGSLYQYFDDKHAVVGALLDQSLRSEAERIAQALDRLAALEPAVARDKLVRLVLSERRGRAHLLRILDAHAAELGYGAPLRHVLRAQADTLADPLHRFAAAQLATAFRGAFDEGLAVVARFLHALGYAFAVDAAEHLEDESIARSASAGLIGLERAPESPGRLAAHLHAAWLGGSGAAWADAAARARRLRETRSALVSSGEIPMPALEPTVFVVSAIGEVSAELRDDPPPRIAKDRAERAAAQLLEACLAAVR